MKEREREREKERERERERDVYEMKPKKSTKQEGELVCQRD